MCQPQVGPAYSALASLCVQLLAARDFEALLEVCRSPSSARHRDGLRANRAGITTIAPLVKQIVKELGARAVISDSRLCAGGQNREGLLIRSLLTEPVLPWQGASFVRGSFRSAVCELWKSHPEATRIVILIAGNDLGRAEATEIISAMTQLKTYWSDWGIELLFVDVVPVNWYEH